MVMMRNAVGDLQVSQAKPPYGFSLHCGRFLVAFFLVAGLLIAAQAFQQFLIDNVAIISISLSLMLIGALSAGRGLLLTPSLRELAFYFFAIIAAGMMWPGAQFALSAYEETGFMALAAFMIFIFTLAVALALLSPYLLAGPDDET
jgi:hypothetical protein